MCVDYFTICRNFIHVAPMTPRTNFAWTDGNDAENHDCFRLCGTNRPKCAECPSINKILFHIVINYAAFWSKVMSEFRMVGFSFVKGCARDILSAGVWRGYRVSYRIIGNWFEIDLLLKFSRGADPLPFWSVHDIFQVFSCGIFFYTICIFKDILKEREREKKKYKFLQKKLHSICMYLLTLYEEELRIRNKKIFGFFYYLRQKIKYFKFGWCTRTMYDM